MISLNKYSEINYKMYIFEIITYNMFIIHRLQYTDQKLKK